jgi:hypothetical protein
MKSIAFFLSIFTILTIAACKKADLIAITKKTSIVSNATLPGKWKVAGNWMSSGGPMYFVPATGDDHVQFNSDGTMTGSAFSDFKLYTVKDSVTIKMTSADQAKYENYFYKIKGDTLTLGMAGPIICIEGCAVTLVKE